MLITTIGTTTATAITQPAVDDPSEVVGVGLPPLVVTLAAITGIPATVPPVFKVFKRS